MASSAASVASAASVGEALSLAKPLLEVGQLLVVADFDGTLSPIVADLTAAAVLPAARRSLRRLARLADGSPDRLRVALLSGRQAADLAARVRVGGIDYLGIHGVERGVLARRRRPGSLDVSLDPGLAAYEPLARRLGEEVAGRIGRPWLVIESKGPNVAFHYRLAGDPAAARLAILAAIREVEADLDAGSDGLTFAVGEGRLVIELRPAVAEGKAAAMRLLLRSGPAAVLALGDDLPDIEAFEVLRAARAAGSLRAVIVGVLGRAETPDRLAEVADVCLPSPAEAATLLARLATELERRSGPDPGRVRDPAVGAIPPRSPSPASPSPPSPSSASPPTASAARRP